MADSFVNEVEVKSFGQRLTDAIVEKQTPALVGIDPRIDQIPDMLKSNCDLNNIDSIASVFEQFSKGIIDVVADRVPAIKPQAAFFEQLGPVGMAVLARVNQYAQDKGLLVVVDGKRGDIGSTAHGYAQAFLSKNNLWCADALTVNPFLGDDSLEPFTSTCQSSGTGIFVLVKTSNPGGKFFQDRICESKPIYRYVAEHVQKLASLGAEHHPYGDVGAVVGATHPEQLIELREVMSNAIFLVPGFGAQGGSAADVGGAFDELGRGALINSSRGIIFAHSREEYSHLTDWQSAVEQATNDMIAQLASETRAAKLKD